MFDKIKQLKKAREIQNSLKDKEVRVERNDFLIIIDGQLRIKEIKLNSQVEKEKQEEVLKSLLNEAMEKAQMMVAKEISQMGGMGF